MNILRIIDKKYVDNQGVYLIHWKGERSNAAIWHTKSSLTLHHPTQQAFIQSYDQKIMKKYDQLKLKSTNYAFKTTARKIKKVQSQNTKKQQSSQNEEMAQQGQNLIRKVGRPRGRAQRINEVLFEQAKQLLIEEENNMVVPSQQLFLYIKLQKKEESHWIYGDRVSMIQSKRENKSLYEVLWQNGERSEVTEQELIEKDPLRICEYFEKKLHLLKKGRKKMKKQEEEVKRQ